MTFVRQLEGGVSPLAISGSHVLGGGRASAKTLRWDELDLSEEWLGASGAAA